MKVLIIVSHPVPYIIPQFRLMTQHKQVEICVAYCSMKGAQSYDDPEFGTKVSWEDVPILEGYPWVELKNQAQKPGLGKFWGLVNWELWDMITSDRVDVVAVYAGYAYASFWIALAAAKLKKKGFIFVTDASTVKPRSDRAQTLKSRLKPWLLPWIFKLGDAILVSSRLGQEMVCSLGMPKERVILTPSTVDNDWWLARSQAVDVNATRNSLGLPQNAPVLLFCAKLQPWKRPQDVLQGFAQAGVEGSYLVFAGDGPMRAELETEAENLGIRDRVLFLGFLNQSELPAIYTLADLFILPSEYEPFGVVVNEAMLCGCPAIVSDRVGARSELIENGKTGYIYPCGDVAALGQLLKSVLSDRSQLSELSIAARDRLSSWSPRENVAAQIHALKLACERNNR